MAVSQTLLCHCAQASIRCHLIVFSITWAVKEPVHKQNSKWRIMKITMYFTHGSGSISVTCTDRWYLLTWIGVVLQEMLFTKRLDAWKLTAVLRSLFTCDIFFLLKITIIVMERSKINLFHLTLTYIQQIFGTKKTQNVKITLSTSLAALC